MSTSLRLLAAPFMGAAFALFLPFIGFAMLAYYGCQVLGRALTRIPFGRPTDSPHRA